MASSKAIGIPAAIVAIILFVLFLSSTPTIEVKMYNSNESGSSRSTVFSETDIKQTFFKDDNRFEQWSSVCFRIKNTGQEVQSQTKLTASNFILDIKTSAICDGCETSTDYTKLEPQQVIEPCRKIKVPEFSKKVTFDVNAYYDAIIPLSSSTKYVCNFVEERENKMDFICNIQK